MSIPDQVSGPILDCLVIGGGPAGLTTAVYLARFKRSCLLIDAGSSRLNRIAKTRNVLGFPDGIAGSELLQRVREHAARYAVAVESACVDKLVALEGGGFEASGGARLGGEEEEDAAVLRGCSRERGGGDGRSGARRRRRARSV